MPDNTSEADQAAMKDRVEQSMNNLRFAKFNVNIVLLETEISEKDYLIYDHIVKGTLDEQPQATQIHSKKWIRYAKTIHDRSYGARLCVISLPRPRTDVSPYDYLSWLDVLTSEFHAPTMLIRGNGRNILTTH